MKKNLIIWIFIIALTVFGFYFIKNNVKIIDNNTISEINTVNEEKNAENIQTTNSINKLSYKENFYYSQLNNNSQIIYDAIYSNKDKLKSGNYTLEFKDEFDSLLKSATGADTLSLDFQDAWCAFMYDNPDMFYIDISKIEMKMESKQSIWGTDYIVKIGPENEENSYLENIGINVETAITRVENQKQAIINSLHGNDYEKIKQIHDWLIDNITYDDNKTINRYNIYGALYNKTAVCEGYAKAFKYLLDEIGTECIIVGGQATNSNGKTESHAWNYVKLNNEWYGVDVTWDDPIVTGGGTIGNDIKYKYFMKSKTSFDNNHVEDISLVQGGTTFTYPNLSMISL